MSYTAAPPRWAGAYLGIPYRLNSSDHTGCDCVGLCQLVMRERMMIEVSRNNIYVGELSKLDPNTVQGFVGHTPWTTILKPGEERPYDWVLMHGMIRMHLAPIHVGIVTAHGWVLHVEEGNLSQQVRFSQLYGRVILIARHDNLK